MSELKRSNTPNRYALAAAAGSMGLALLLTGCGSSDGTETASKPAPKAIVNPKVHITVFPDGTRQLDFTELNNSHYYDFDNAAQEANYGSAVLNTLTQWCMDKALYTEFSSRFTEGGAAITSIANAPICQDDRITESDGFAGPAYVFDPPKPS